VLLYTSGDQKGSLKLADFGLARCYNVPLRQYTHEVVTLWYRAPEVLLGGKVYSNAVDVWSLGCIFGELGRKGRPMFPGDSEIDQLHKIFQKMGRPTEEIWPGLTDFPDWRESFPTWPARDLAEIAPDLPADGIDLLQQMLVYDPRARITVAEALAHPFLASITTGAVERPLSADTVGSERDAEEEHVFGLTPEMAVQAADRSRGDTRYDVPTDVVVAAARGFGGGGDEDA
jgi:serine/threonine protein kinase